MKKLLIVFLLGGCLMLSPFGCGVRYSVDYCGAKNCFKGAEDSYPAGTAVSLEFWGIATDTSYTFYVDGKEVYPSYRNGSLYIDFTMPDHDITVDFTSRNDMARECTP